MTKKKLLLIIALVLAILTLGYGATNLGVKLYDSYVPSQKKQDQLKKEANKLVEDLFVAISEQDDAQLEEFMNISELTLPSSDVYDLDANEILGYISNDVEFKIKKTTFVSNSRIDVFGTVTAPDLGAVWGQAKRNSITKNLKKLEEEADTLTDKEKDQLIQDSVKGEFISALADANNHTVYTDVTIHYVRNGLKWEIEPDEELENAILGGLYKAINTSEINNER